MSDSTAIIPPTCTEIQDEDGLELVQTNSDSSWRHGTYERDIFSRKSDGTFWEVHYQLSGDGEYNTLRDDPGMAIISRVYPKEVISTIYTNEKPD